LGVVAVRATRFVGSSDVVEVSLDGKTFIGLIEAEQHLASRQRSKEAESFGNRLLKAAEVSSSARSAVEANGDNLMRLSQNRREVLVAGLSKRARAAMLGNSKEFRLFLRSEKQTTPAPAKEQAVPTVARNSRKLGN
jgi:hypothetical protein